MKVALRRKRVERQLTPNSIDPLISDFWASLATPAFSPALVDRVWVANRCIQLTAQQIAAMPLRFYGGGPSSLVPAWVSSPDPVWYPNGIGDAVFAAARSMYGWGDAFLYITDRYESQWPRTWTVLDPGPIQVRMEGGRRRYRSGQTELDPDRVVQILRNPTGELRGTSALAAFGAKMFSTLASADLGRAIMDGGIPNAVLKSQRKLDKDQAEALQDQWAARTAVRRGVPAVLPPEIDFEELSFSPKDLLLLDAQEFDARVIAAAFGIPPFLLNMPLAGGLTYQNPEMLFEQWWRAELRPAAIRMAQALSANMLPRGSWVEFDSRDVLAPSFKDLISAWKDIIGFGGATVDEFRAAVLRLPPQPESASISDLLQPSVSNANGQAAVQPLRPDLREVTG